MQDDEAAGIGITHPRILTITQRETIVRNGLGDREEVVKDAVSKLLGTWVDVVRADGTKKENDGGIVGDLIAFLKLFDLSEGTVGEDALLSVFKARTEIFENIEFEGTSISARYMCPSLWTRSDTYWDGLTPEKTFLARVFVDHCKAKGDNRIEVVLPVVTALAFRIQDSYNDLVRRIEVEEEHRLLEEGMTPDVEDDEARVKREEGRMDREFVIGEMLRMALNLDYGDEIGRRKMFQLVREYMSFAFESQFFMFA